MYRVRCNGGQRNFTHGWYSGNQTNLSNGALTLIESSATFYTGIQKLAQYDLRVSVRVLETFSPRPPGATHTSHYGYVRQVNS